MAITKQQEKWYVDQMKVLDPKSEVVSIEQDKGVIHYNSTIKSDESHSKDIGPEELVHALTIVILNKKMGYPLERIYHEKYIQYGSANSKPKEIDILILDEDDLPYAVWEMKSSQDYDKDMEGATNTQLFGTAPLLTNGAPRFVVCATIDPMTTEPLFKMRCIDYKEHKDYLTWVADTKPTIAAFPVDYREPDYQPYVRGGNRDLRTNCSLSEFRSVATAFHNEFFSEHPDNQLFENLVKCLLAKISSEKNTAVGEEYRFQITYRKGKAQSAQEVFDKINLLYKDAYKRYIDPLGEDEIDSRQFSAERVKSVVSSLEGMALTTGSALSADIMGAFFEEILRAGFKQDRGMYFTHDNIARFMVEAVGLRSLTQKKWKSASHPNNRLPYVIDPACGAGTFLLHAMHCISSSIRGDKAKIVLTVDDQDYFDRNLSDKAPNAWAKDFLYGFDYKFIMAMTAKVNMVLHGDGVSHIFKDDAFRPLKEYSDDKFRPLQSSKRVLNLAEYKPDVCETFDVVVSNPPFGVKLSTETTSKLSETFSLGEKQSTEGLFIERSFQLLKPEGRLAVVLPESILNASENKAVRLLLYRLFNIRAVVQMPRNIFVDTPTLTSLLFAQKKTRKEIQEWDAMWTSHLAEAEKKIKDAKKHISAKYMKSRSKQAGDIESGILSALAPVVSREDWIVVGGKNARVLSLTLPGRITKKEDAAEYYKAIFSSASFGNLVTQYVFKQTAHDIGNDWASYIVKEVGFKLSNRKERARENQLCVFKGVNSGGLINNLHLGEEQAEVVINTESPKTVLDFISSDVNWS